MPGVLVQVSWSGAYRCVCVRLRLFHLAVNAVCQAGLLGELEGAVLAEGQAGSDPSFKVLRHLVSNWLNDATQFGSRWVIPCQTPWINHQSPPPPPPPPLRPRLSVSIRYPKWSHVIVACASSGSWKMVEDNAVQSHLDALCKIDQA